MNKFSELIQEIDAIKKKIDDCILPINYPLTSEQEQKLINGKDSIHIVPGTFPLSISGLYTLLNVCKTIEDREGKRGMDYVICVHDIDGEKRIVVDTTNSFFCDEDFK